MSTASRVPARPGEARILWQTRWGSYCAGLDELFPIAAVLSIDDSRAHDVIAAERGIRFLSADRRGGRRIGASEESFDAAFALLGGKIDELLDEGRDQWTVVSPVPCRALAAHLRRRGVPCVCAAPDLAAQLSDKRFFLAALEAIGVAPPPGRWLDLAPAGYSELAAELGASFFVQLPQGTSGSGTRLVSSPADLEAARQRLGAATVRVSPDLGRLSLNVNAIALTRDAVVAYPSVQLDGLAPLRARRGQYCGNDYAATARLSRGLLAEVREQTQRIGRWLAGLGFRGLFGLDFVVDERSGRPFAVDLNPRWQGSTALLTQLQIMAGRLPLAAAELAWRLGLLGEDEVLSRREDFFAPVAAAVMSLRWDGAGWARVTGDVPAGIYASLPFRFLRPGTRQSQLAPGELLVTGGAPRRGALVGEESHLTRIACAAPVIEPLTMRVDPGCAAAAETMRAALALCPERAPAVS